MKRILAFALLLMSVLLSSRAQDSGLPIGEDPKPTVFRGRIVLYDWFSHEFSASEDFVVKTFDSNTPYIRVMYRPQWAFDAPAEQSTNNVLNRWAFIAHGALWDFSVVQIKTDSQTNWCRLHTLTYKYEDESGRGEIPRFVPAPGANLAGIPPVKDLPCFILKPGGLTQVPNPGQGGARR